MSCCFYRNHPPDPASPEALWGNARGCWEAFALLFGSALALVGEVFIRSDQRNEANAFLRGLENLVRRLLLIEATRLPRAADAAAHITPTHRKSTRPKPPPDGSAELETESAASWPAHFPLRLNALLGAHLPEPRDVTLASHWPHRRRTPAPPSDDPLAYLPRFVPAAPIAIRLEALRRVIAEPAPFIARAAKALARFRSGNRPPRLIPTTQIPGDNGRFLWAPLRHVDAAAARAIDDHWNDTS